MSNGHSGLNGSGLGGKELKTKFYNEKDLRNL